MIDVINERELRVGNWVLLGKDQVQFDLQTFKDWDYYSFHPIPLTPEVLERCGFKSVIDIVPSHRKQLNHYCDLDIFGDGSTGITFEKRNVPIMKVVVGLHQLMNLWHALTGTELDYKP